MKALTALACIPFGSYRRTIVLFTKKFDGLQTPMLCNQLAWDHACIYIFK